MFYTGIKSRAAVRGARYRLHYRTEYNGIHRNTTEYNRDICGRAQAICFQLNEIHDTIETLYVEVHV